MFKQSKIRSITPAGLMKVADITVDTDSSYVGNGIVNHNSSKDPNLQNIPTNSKLYDETSKIVTSFVKKSFTVPEGKTLIQLDYSQAELRVVASFANEKAMLTAYENDQDLHAVTAANMLKLSLEAFYELDKDTQKKWRTRAKAGNFGLLYGMSAGGFKDYARNNYGVELTDKEAEDTRKLFFQTYPNLLEYHATYIAKGRKFGYVRTLFGRKRHTPDIHSSDNLKRSNDERVGINCVTEDTEIMTVDGWKKFSDLYEGQQVYSVNPKTRDLELDTIHKLNVHEFCGKLTEFNTNALSCVSTDNHRWLVDSKRTKGVVTDFIVTEKISNHGDHRVWLTGNCIKVDNNNIWTDDEVEFIGWVLTDGYYIKSKKKDGTFKNVSTIGISQVKEKNIKPINDLWLRLGGTSMSLAASGQYFWNLSGEFGYRVKKAMPDKTLTPEFLSQLNSNQLVLLYNTMLLGDGSLDNRCNSYRRFTASSEHRADMFAYLCTLIGVASHVSYKKASKPVKMYDSMTNIPITEGWWNVEIKTRTTTQIVKKSKSTIDYSGKVWCPTTTNSTWIAKRNGKIFVTGNSPIQGTAGEFTIFALALLYNRLDPRVQIANSVHDSIILYCPDEILEETIELLRLTCENLPTEQYFGKSLRIGMKVDIETSKTHWGDLKS